MKTLHSLSRVFPDRPIREEDLQTRGSMLKNEVFSFQIAYWLTDGGQVPCVITDISHTLGDALTISSVNFVPCDHPAVPDAYPYCERTQPGLFPDILQPIPKQLWAYEGSCRSLWLRVDGTEAPLTPGEYDITISIFALGQGTEQITYHLTVLDAVLPPQTLICTNWFHTDCLCNYYHVEFDSEAYWKITQQFAETAVKYGINMLLTPIFTPPLDTEVGGQRRTIQLIDVRKEGNTYTFGFDKLHRWIGMCRKAGVQYFEISHLYTQWGCKHAPKIMGYADGTYQQLFGWDTEAQGAEYRGFLSQLLPALTAFLDAEGVRDCCYFHVSDEPSIEMLEDYRQSAEFLKQYLEGFHIFDALSSIEFYRTGAVPCPVPATDHIEPFLKEKPEGLWTYYCCGQVTTSNRFLAFSSARNRILGTQLFRYDIVGFLQWGFNFYNTFLSRETIDPYASSTAGGWVPGGDTFVVYPGPDGEAVPSLRLEVFREALQDMRALQALSAKKGKQAVLALLDPALTFKNFRDDPQEILSLRETVNRMLCACD